MHPSANHDPTHGNALHGVIGILGGMGPLATVDLMRKLVEASPAGCDQDHVPVIASSIPQIPDRGNAFRNAGASPLPGMRASGQRLVAAGAGLIVIACNTAHVWFDELQAALRMPMLHIVDAALDEVAAQLAPHQRVGLLATDTTLAAGLYTARAPSCGVQWLLPSSAEMADWVMPGIFAVKAGDIPTGRRLLQRAAEALRRRGAGLVVLGCTEIPLVLQADDVDLPLVDATAALARRAVRWSRTGLLTPAGAAALPSDPSQSSCGQIRVFAPVERAL